MTTPIREYALLGDTRTAALVSSDGSIDWMCLPRFDGQPIFGRLVGGDETGSFHVRPATPQRQGVLHRYRGDTATVETMWVTPTGRLTLTDSMVSEVTGRLYPATLLVRQLFAHDHPVEVAISFDPRLGEHSRPPRVRRDHQGIVCLWPNLALSITTTGTTPIQPGATTTEIVEPGRPVTLVVGSAHRQPVILVTPDEAFRAVEADERRWQRWSDGIDPDIRHRDQVVRSLLTLRLLTYSPSGAPVAAPTTSLPEELGGRRNWDYRYAWPRDASIGIAAFLQLGKPDEARSFLSWLLHATRLDRPRLPALLTLHGRPVPPEQLFAHWAGYADSRPVRFGNGASGQHQLDGYGWVIDGAWLLVAHGHRLRGETWRALRSFADQVADRWDQPDSGIWEVRDEPAHYVHSKLMAWLATDRALRIAGSHRTPQRQRRRWEHARAGIARDLAQFGTDPATGAYTRTYASREADAATLLAPLIGLNPVDSPVIAATIASVRQQLGAGGPLLYRYPPGVDGIEGREGAFLPCSFWLVQALALTGAEGDAGDLFDQLVRLAGPLGLLPEEIDPTTGAYLGNYPQALTHAALVQAALALPTADTNTLRY